MKTLSTLLFVFLLLAVPLVAQPDSRTDSPRVPGDGIPAHVAGGGGLCPAPLNLCYYDLGLEQGNPSQVAPIGTAGHTPVDVVTPDAAGLAACDVLFAQNPSNGGFGAEWIANLADIDAAVQGGMVLVFHDRFVTDAALNIPGLAPTTCLRDFGDDTNIDVVDDMTSVTSGPGGIIDDTSLDGGNSSSHGFCDEATLPAGGRNILSRTAAADSATFSYEHGGGSVVYSTIPLDFYLEGNLPAAFGDIYAPNVVQYGADLFCGPQPLVIEVPTLGIAGMVTFALLLVLCAVTVWIRRRARA